MKTWRRPCDFDNSGESKQQRSGGYETRYESKMEWHGRTLRNGSCNEGFAQWPGQWPFTCIHTFIWRVSFRNDSLKTAKQENLRNEWHSMRRVFIIPVVIHDKISQLHSTMMAELKKNEALDFVVIDPLQPTYSVYHITRHEYHPNLAKMLASLPNWFIKRRIDIKKNFCFDNLFFGAGNAFETMIRTCYHQPIVLSCCWTSLKFDLWGRSVPSLAEV